MASRQALLDLQFNEFTFVQLLFVLVSSQAVLSVQKYPFIWCEYLGTLSYHYCGFCLPIEKLESWNIEMKMILEAIERFKNLLLFKTVPIIVSTFYINLLYKAIYFSIKIVIPWE